MVPCMIPHGTCREMNNDGWHVKRLIRSEGLKIAVWTIRDPTACLDPKNAVHLLVLILA